ncbi:hypothetical protein L227DRAFT_94949 [Lentinus tigrinus ALCF2SS1-6]|uniref:Uncharacterized protein n=1 Tax=Lentinus tigrinus ALCF2SS1-6 TaxID=1328759 RepID=A0A5C2S8Z6_9APHY|nr:hypothetical protein L227DRAFT_94949 [Lentinus tigrinus ALCF2SS1-6]
MLIGSVIGWWTLDSIWVLAAPPVTIGNGFPHLQAAAFALTAAMRMTIGWSWPLARRCRQIAAMRGVEPACGWPERKWGAMKGASGREGRDCG